MCLSLLVQSVQVVGSQLSFYPRGKGIAVRRKNYLDVNEEVEQAGNLVVGMPVPRLEGLVLSLGSGF